MLRIDEEKRRIITQSGGRGLLVLGVALAGLGIFSLAALLRIGLDTLDRPWLGLLSLFVVAGFALAFGRYRREIDLERNEIRSIFSCLVTLYRSRQPLAKLQQVRISYEVRHSKNDASIVYPVRLQAEGPRYQLTAGRDEAAARRQAEAVARLTGLDLVDFTSGHPVMRPTDQLDASILELGDGAGEEEMPEPAGCRLGIQPASYGVRIRVPVTGRFHFRRWASLGYLPAALAIWWLAWRPAVTADGDDDLASRLRLYVPLAIVLGVLLVVSTARALRSRHRTHTLVVTARGLSELRLFGVLTIPADELEELVVRELPDIPMQPIDQAAFLQARSDTAEIRCGYGLSTDELAYLRQVILRGLRGGHERTPTST